MTKARGLPPGPTFHWFRKPSSETRRSARSISIRSRTRRHGGGGPHVLATPGVSMRDEAAYQLLALGYSARETADVVSGRISQQALDTARQMLAVGQTRDVAANYLDAQYKRVVALRNARIAPVPPTRRGVLPTAFDALIEKYANLHQVEAAIVRAIIETESAFNPLALSRKGAIGLMQLMPMTARELGRRSVRARAEYRRRRALLLAAAEDVRRESSSPSSPTTEGLDTHSAMRAGQAASVRRDARLRQEGPHTHQRTSLTPTFSSGAQAYVPDAADQINAAFTAP